MNTETQFTDEEAIEVPSMTLEEMAASLEHLPRAINGGPPQPEIVKTPVIKVKAKVETPKEKEKREKEEYAAYLASDEVVLKLTEGRKPKILIGYQWGNEMQYIGEYKFHNNVDKDEIHMPAFTTLIPPPKVPVDEEAIWNGESWGTRRLEMNYMEDRPRPSQELLDSLVGDQYLKQTSPSTWVIIDPVAEAAAEAAAVLEFNLKEKE